MPRSSSASRAPPRATCAGGSSTARNCTTGDKRTRLLRHKRVGVRRRCLVAGETRPVDRAFRGASATPDSGGVAAGSTGVLCGGDAQARGGSGDGTAEGRDPGSRPGRAFRGERCDRSDRTASAYADLALGRSDRSRRAIGGCGGFFTLPFGGGWVRCIGAGSEGRGTGGGGK